MTHPAFDGYELVTIPVGTPEEDPDTSLQYTHARQEGWYALSLVAPNTIPAAMTAESLAEDVRMSSPGVEYDEVDIGHISPDLNTWTAVYALRLSLRVLVTLDPSDERDNALFAIGEALRGVDDPD